LKKYLKDMLICPVCKSDLTLEIQSELDEEVITGNLNCNNKECNEIYPIEESIPNLLPPDLR
jgi:uncharacterized protein YbaR (Trm112 family)